MDDSDSPAIHAEDTLKSGGSIAGEEAVLSVCSAAPDIVRRLEQLGVVFSRNEDGKCYGAVLYNESYLTASQSEQAPAQLVEEYRTHFGAGCSKVLSCQNVCPAGIETISSIIKMNRM